MKITSVLVVDDHPIVTAGIEIIIKDAPEFTIVAKAETPQQAIDCVERCQPDIAILDLSLGGRDGIALIKRIHEIRKTTRILVFSTSDELTYAVRSVKAGASGYLMKREGLEELLIALKWIKLGNIYLSEPMKSFLLDKKLNDIRQQTDDSQLDSELEHLTDRELQILQFIGKGYATGKIAERLHLSPKTVSAHKEKLKLKLAASSSTDLLCKAISFAEKQLI